MWPSSHGPTTPRATHARGNGHGMCLWRLRLCARSVLRRPHRAALSLCVAPAPFSELCSGAYESQPCAAKLVVAVEAVCCACGAVDYAPEFRLWRAGQNDEHFDETIAARPALADVECAPPTRSDGRVNRVPHRSAYVT